MMKTQLDDWKLMQMCKERIQETKVNSKCNEKIFKELYCLKTTLKIINADQFVVRIKTKFVGYLSRGGQNSQSNCLVPA